MCRRRCRHRVSVDQNQYRSTPSMYTFICMSVCMSIHMSMCMSVCMSIRMSMCMSVCMSIHMSVHVSVHTYMHMSIHLLCHPHPAPSQNCCTDVYCPGPGMCTVHTSSRCLSPHGCRAFNAYLRLLCLPPSHMAVIPSTPSAVMPVHGCCAFHPCPRLSWSPPPPPCQRLMADVWPIHGHGIRAAMYCPCRSTRHRTLSISSRGLADGHHR